MDACPKCKDKKVNVIVAKKQSGMLLSRCDGEQTTRVRLYGDVEPNIVKIICDSCGYVYENPEGFEIAFKEERK